MKLKRENELKKNCETESSKKDDEKESEREKKSERKKEREKKKDSEKKIESEKNERKKKKKNKRVFMLRRVMLRVFFIQTSLYLYSCTKRHVLILTNLTNLCLVLFSLCCRNMRTYFLMMCLVDCHLLEE